MGDHHSKKKINKKKKKFANYSEIRNATLAWFCAGGSLMVNIELSLSHLIIPVGLIKEQKSCS
jgi:hypothetical protein